MQSYLQYRRLGRRLEQQIKEHVIRGPEIVSRCATFKTNQRPHDSTATTYAIDNYITFSNAESLPAQADVGKREDVSFPVNFDSSSDPLNAQSWSKTRKWTYTFLIGATGFIVSGAAAFDTSVTPQAAESFDVSEEVALLSTTLYMVALGLGSLVSAAFSETVGRNPIYIICM